MYFEEILNQLASKTISNYDLKLLQEFADALPFGIYIRELNSLKFVFVNQKLSDILSYSKEEFLSSNLFIQQSSQVSYNEKITEKLINQVGKLQKVKMKDKNGQIVNLIHSFYIFYDNNKNPYSLGVLIDAKSESDTTLLSIFSKTFELQEFFEYINIPTALMNRKLKQIINANISLRNYFKINNDDLTAINSIFFKNESFLENYNFFLNRNFDFFEFQCNLVDIENNSIPSVCILNRCPESNCDLLFVHPLLSENTDTMTSLVTRKSDETNENLIKSNFITLVSHEFRTPLTKILLATDLLMNYDEKMNREDKIKQFNEIKDTIYGMTKLMEAVLTVSKMEQNLYNPEYEIIDIRVFFEMILDGFLVRNNKGLVYNFNFKAITRFIPIEMTLMTLICNNLIDNATKFSKPNTTIDISVYADLDNNINIEIKDNGIGIPENEVDMIFNSFYKASNNRNYEGYGLGMFIVKKSIDLLQGQITIDSQIDVGTTVRVFIPTPHQIK